MAHWLSIRRTSGLSRTVGLSFSLRPTTHVRQPLLQDGPGPAPLGERLEDLLQDRELLVERGQLGLKSLDASSLRGNAGGDRLQLRRRRGARRQPGRQRRQGRRRWAGPTQPGQAIQPLGGSAELSDELLHQVRNFDGRALLIIGHRLLLSEKIIIVSPPSRTD